ncbi:MAG: hypothetical protein ACSHX8_10790 [Opitutaceae bacterium]
MRYKAQQDPISLGLTIANTCIAGIIFYSVYLANMKGIGKGALPIFAIPAGLMVTAIYIFAYLIITNEQKKITKWIVTTAFAVIACLVFYGIYTH